MPLPAFGEIAAEEVSARYLAEKPPSIKDRLVLSLEQMPTEGLRSYKNVRMLTDKDGRAK